jgi:3-methyl-2-oxobutanoate hydroxymethyltransferase
MVMQGETTTVNATIEAQVLFSRAVAKGAGQQLLVGDLPFLSYRMGLELAMQNVMLLMQAGMHAVKLEGCQGNLELIRHLVDSGVPVMGHIGLTPQAVHQLSGFKVQGKTPQQAEALLEQALALEQAGCFAIVLECVPPDLAETITKTLTIPVIGIGAGASTDGQVLVWHDLLGLNPEVNLKFAKAFCAGFATLQRGLQDYDDAVKQQQFPQPEHCFKKVALHADIS